MPIRKVIPRSLDSAAASANLNFDAGTLFVDSTNNRVGIKQASPALPLHVTSTDENVALFQNSNNSPALIRLREPATTNDPYIASYGNSMAFGTYGGTEYARFTSTGLGIGTSSPSTKLQVVGTTLLASASTYGASTAAISVYNGSSSANYYKADNHYFQLAAGTDTLTINSAGAVALSTAVASGGYNLFIRNPTDTGGDNTRYAGIQFQIGSDQGTAAIQAYRTNSAADYSTALTFLTKGAGAPATNPVERMRITSGGNVGIGTSSPTTGLVVAFPYSIDTIGSPSKWTSLFRDTSAMALGVGGSLLFQGSKSSGGAVGNYGGIAGLKENGNDGNEQGYLALFSVPASGIITERMRIASDGNVGIGTTAATGKLDVRGNLYVNTTASGSSPANGGYFGVSDGGLYLSTVTSAPIEFAIANSEKMRLDSSGNLLVGGTTALANGALMVGNNSTTRPIVAIGSGGVDGTYINGIVFFPWNGTECNVIRNSVSVNAGNSGFQFMVSDGGGASTQTQSFRINRTSCTVIGSLSKGSGSFKIDHPLPEKTETHHLVHSFIEGPQADLIYRGKVNLVAGTATVNIDTAARMTQGTFEVLCRDVQCFTTNESDWTAVRGSVNGNILTIEAQDSTSTASISWMVIGERKDKHMYDTEWTDDDGKVIVEPLKVQPEEIAPVETE